MVAASDNGGDSMIANAVTVSMSFLTWFRVGAAYPLDGLDLSVDHDDPVPADHMRGLMRAEARWLVSLGVGTDRLVSEVFGTSGAPGAWAWGPVHPTQQWRFEHRHRVAIDDATHTARSDQLVAGEVAWAPEAHVRITQVRQVPNVADHERLLRLAACSVHHIGSWRRRGLGAVRVTVDPTPCAADLHALRQLAGRQGVPA